MPRLEHIEAIERRLWEAADTLRANFNCASNEYFLPAMGLCSCATLRIPTRIILPRAERAIPWKSRSLEV